VATGRRSDVAWAPTIPVEPPTVPGWWTELETAEQYETPRWVEGIAAEVRAERIERLHQRCHEVYMAAAGALSADRWKKIQRRRDERDAVWRGGYLVDRTTGREVEHRDCARILGIR
jgi:hypothetical protein